MNIKASRMISRLLLVALAGSIGHLTYGNERPALISIPRNVAWNDLITQVQFLPSDSPQDSLNKDLLIIQEFLKAHETKVTVGIYDLKVFRAIDRVRVRLKKADKDLETIRDELSYKVEQAKAGE